MSKANPALIIKIDVPNNHIRLGEVVKAFGGAYAGTVRGEKDRPDYHLFVAVGDAGQARDIAWGGYGIKESAEAEHNHDGLANTLALVASGADHPAAKWARDLKHEGYADWYLPSREELRLCYINAREHFDAVWHWSSTQYAGNSDNAWGQNFDNGGQSVVNKDYQGRARAVRRVIINSVL